MIWSPKFETMPRPELEKLQLERLKALVARVYEKVPFYRQAFQQKGKDYSTAADLTGQADHLGATIEADIIKQKQPTKNGGYTAWRIVVQQMTPGQVTEEVKKSGLRGRGGAGEGDGRGEGGERSAPPRHPRLLAQHGRPARGHARIRARAGRGAPRRGRRL